MTDFAYDGPIFLVPLSLSYPRSPVSTNLGSSRKTSELNLGEFVYAGTCIAMIKEYLVSRASNKVLYI